LFKMNFVLKEQENGPLSLVLPIWFRILFIFIAVLLGTGIYASSPENNKQWIPILLTVGCIAGAFYNEKWIFHKNEGTIVHSSGILFITKKRIVDFKDVDSFILSGDTRIEKRAHLSRPKKKMAKHSLIMKSGEIYNIDILSGKTDVLELLVKAEKIASYCNIKLTVSS
jgi:uncharacterized membrane protein